MKPYSKPNLHKCVCQTCQQHPYSAVAKEHQAINRVVAGLDEKIGGALWDCLHSNGDAAALHG